MKKKQEFVKIPLHGGIGEVVNTPDCGSGTRGFDPHISPQNGKKSKDLLIEIDSYESIFLFVRKELVIFGN